MAADAAATIEEGTLSFTIESRILRELGERLVKQPEVALLELVKNSYDADARRPEIIHDPSARIVVCDNGRGLTLEEFTHVWMRIFFRAKEPAVNSRLFSRVITGER